MAGGVTTAEVVKEEKKEPNQSKHVHEALHQLVMRYSTDAKDQQLEISCLWRQLWAAKKAVADYDIRLARARNHNDYVSENSEPSDIVKQHCYTCLLSKLQQQIWLMKGLCFVPSIRNTLTNAAITHDMQGILLGEMLDAVSSAMRQEIVVLTVQITRDRKKEVRANVHSVPLNIPYAGHPTQQHHNLGIAIRSTNALFVCISRDTRESDDIVIEIEYRMSGFAVGIAPETGDCCVARGQ